MTIYDLEKQVAAALGMNRRVNSDPKNTTWDVIYEPTHAQEPPFVGCNEVYLLEPQGNGWNVYGFMVQDAAFKGWDVQIKGSYLYFWKDGRTGRKEIPEKKTQGFSYEAFGHIKACAWAYLDMLKLCANEKP